MSDSVFQKFGGLELPVGIDDVTNSLSSLDPARDRLLALFASAINSEFADVWTEVTAALTTGSKLASTTPVQDTLPDEPTIELIQQRKISYPLLCLHRTGEATIAPFLMDEDILTQQWHLHYILGDLDIDGTRRLLDICQAIAKLVAAVIRDYGHHSYESGANQIEAADLNSLRIVSYIQPGRARFGEDGPVFWATRITLESTEVSAPITDQLSDFNGMDMSFNVGGANEEDISPDFVSASTDPAYQYP